MSSTHLCYTMAWAGNIGTTCKPGLTDRLTAFLKCTQSMDLLWRVAAVGTSTEMQGQRKGVPYLFTHQAASSSDDLQYRNEKLIVSLFFLLNVYTHAFLLLQLSGEGRAPPVCLFMDVSCYCTLSKVQKDVRFLEPNGGNLEYWTLQMSEWLLIKRDQLSNPYALSCLCISHCMMIRK